MSTRKNDIRTALRTHLLGFGDLPMMTNEDGNEVPAINWEGRSFEVPREMGNFMPYIRETLLPADELVTANEETTGIGIYQLDLIIPTGYSISEAEELADDLKSHFHPAQTIDFVIIERSAVGQMNEQDQPWSIIPIQIDYRVHNINFKPA